MGVHQWDGSRYMQSPGPLYESYFIRGNHPSEKRAFWLRYTLFCGRKGPLKPEGELWIALFENGQPVRGGMNALPWAECSFSAEHLRVHLGDSTLDERSAHGGLTTDSLDVKWNLRWEGKDEPALLLKPSLYRGGFPKAKSVVPRPMVRFTGEIAVNEQSWSIADWVGSQNHNWGVQHTDAYAWGQVAGFDTRPDWFLECASARLQYGPVWTPPFTVAVLRAEGREYRFDGLTRAVRASATWNEQFWEWKVSNGSETLEARFEASPADWIVFPYRNPPGGTKECRNSKVAAVQLSLTRSDGSRLSASTHHRGAFEILR